MNLDKLSDDAINTIHLVVLLILEEVFLSTVVVFHWLIHTLTRQSCAKRLGFGDEFQMQDSQRTECEHWPFFVPCLRSCLSYPPTSSKYKTTADETAEWGRMT